MMSKPTTIFRGSTGLNTLADPVRIYNQNGIKDLAVAGDVDVMDTGRLSRRKGFTSRITGDFRSLFCDGGACCFALGVKLCLLNADYTYIEIADITADATVNYTQINDRIYWCNGHEKGYITNSVNQPWVKGTYVGPDTKRNFSDPPVGTMVEYFNNRMYVVQNNVLWYSEPGAYGAFDLARGFYMWGTNIRMVRAVTDGLYISSGNNTYFLKGNSPKEFQQIKLADYPSIGGSDYKFAGSLVEGSITEGEGESVMWMSNEGVCYGGPGGFKNLTLNKIANFPDGLTGSGLIHNGRYIGLINP